MLTLGACTQDVPDSVIAIYVTTKDGLLVLGQDGRVVRPPTVVAAALPDWSRVVRSAADGAGTRITVEDLGRVLSAVTLPGVLEPRVISLTGTEIASVTPGGAGIYGLHDPGGRERTTVVVSTPDGERARLDLPGNVEPEVFSPDTSRLYVLDFTPPSKPDHFRIGMVDLRTGLLSALTEQRRESRVQRVYDVRRGVLYAMCVDSVDAVASVHCLNVGQGWAQRIGLPPPFGQDRPGVHAIALSDSGDRLVAIHSPSASVADVDPDQRVVKRISSFSATRQDGKPGLAITSSGRLVVGVDAKVIVDSPRLEIPTPGQARGLVLGGHNDVWVGHPDGVVQFDLSTGKEIRRIAVPGLYVLKHVRHIS
jgi:hypothetical protein